MEPPILDIESALISGDAGPVQQFEARRHSTLATSHEPGESYLRVDGFDSDGRWMMLSVTLDNRILTAKSGTHVRTNLTEYVPSGVSSIVVCANREGRNGRFEIDEVTQGAITVEEQVDGTRQLHIQTENSDGSVTHGTFNYRLRTPDTSALQP